MRNWKSTLLGALLAASDILLQMLSDVGFDWSKPSNYVRPILFALLGYVVQDARKAIKVVLVFLVASALLLLPSCGVPIQVTTPWGSASTDAKGAITVLPGNLPIRIPIRVTK